MSHTLAHLVHQYGYLAVIGFFVAEGIGVPLPAETLLVTAGAFAARGKLSIVGVILAGSIGGVLGGTAGYWIGSIGGMPLIRRFGQLIRLDGERVARAQAFFRERGASAAFLVRFVAFLRIVIPMLIGLSSMRFVRFSAFNALGAIAAAATYSTLGFVFGKDLPTLMHHVMLVSAVGVVAIVCGAVAWRFHRGESMAAVSPRR